MTLTGLLYGVEFKHLAPKGECFSVNSLDDDIALRLALTFSPP